MAASMGETEVFPMHSERYLTVLGQVNLLPGMARSLDAIEVDQTN
jgi:hypothetical protein